MPFQWKHRWCPSELQDRANSLDLTNYYIVAKEWNDLFGFTKDINQKYKDSPEFARKDFKERQLVVQAKLKKTMTEKVAKEYLLDLKNRYMAEEYTFLLKSKLNALTNYYLSRPELFFAFAAKIDELYASRSNSFLAGIYDIKNTRNRDYINRSAGIILLLLRKKTNFVKLFIK